MISEVLTMLAILMPVTEPTRCRITILSTSPDHVWPVSHIEQLVDSSDVIVRARPTGQGPGKEPQPLVSPYGKTVRFEVIEQIKADSAIGGFVVYGDLVDVDDFNTSPVPYRTIRRGGQRGNCVATQYRLGAEYLFLLKRRSGELTPYWEGLAP